MQVVHAVLGRALVDAGHQQTEVVEGPDGIELRLVRRLLIEYAPHLYSLLPVLVAFRKQVIQHVDRILLLLFQLGLLRY